MAFRRLKALVTPKIVVDLKNLRPVTKRTCSICSYEGNFGNFGRPPRLDALCPKCGSLERHRLFWLWFKGDKEKLAEPILHFAPEAIFEKLFRKIYTDYRTADLFMKTDLKLNIENIDLETGSVRTVICNHVLEHVDDVKALAEMNRILADDGVLVCSVPIIEGWDTTYENASVSGEADRELHFGQIDHVRFYGRDFRDKLTGAGFNHITEHTAEGQDVITYGLWRGEKFFLCRKNAPNA